MRFGRVEAFVVPTGDLAEATHLDVTVTLETREGIRVVRRATLPVLRPLESLDDLVWHADQYAQEAIGVELAEEGWEAIGVDAWPEFEPGTPARSPAYTVRNLQPPSS